ncbi:hypothetical protein JCM8547_006899 [Rhodosporidiobolus lusitaniae]
MSGYGNNYRGGGGGGGYNQGGGGGYNRGYGGGVGGGGGYGGAGYGGGGDQGYGGGRKRGRDDDYNQGGGGGGGYGGYQRRRQNERGDWQQSPRRGGYGGGGGGGYGQGGMGGNAVPMGGQGYEGQQSLVGMQKRFQEELWKLGNKLNYDPAIDVPEMAKSVVDWYFRDKPTVFLGFRAAVSELPHKLPHYAALLAHLSLKPVAPPSSSNSLLNRISSVAPPSPAPSSYTRPARPTPSAPGLPARPSGLEGLPNKPVSIEEAVKAMDEAAASGDGKDGEAAEEKDGEKEEKKEDEVEKVNVGKEIVQDLMKAFQAFLDERKWKSVRYCVVLFAHLTFLPASSPLISVSSLITLLTSFVSVLDEPGLRAARGDECVRIIVEALLRLDSAAIAGEVGIDTLRDGVQGYLSSRRIEMELFADEETKGQWQDPLEQLVTSLTTASSSDAEDSYPITAVLPDPFTLLSSASSDDTDAASSEPLMLPMILVPPESDEGDLTLGAATGVEHAIPPPPINAGLRGDEGVGYDGTRLTLRLFDDETVPTVYDPAGTVIRSLIGDLITLYETNRKEAATLLLELPRWFRKGTFKAAGSTALAKKEEGDEEMKEGEEKEEEQGPGWSLENMVVESIIVSILSTPSPLLPLVYYYSLLTELCRISPQTVAPSLGKCVRKLYAGLGNDQAEDGHVHFALDAEGIRRFADWFSVHLSNYGFMWGWAEWAPDMDVSEKHPKRVFVKRVIDLEMRLSYFDRIRGTIPEALLDTGVVVSDTPGPEYAYDAPEHTHNAAAMAFLKLIRQKALIEEASDELESFKKALEGEHAMEPEEAEKVKRDMAVQTILHVGSRSFSHFLNALERYLTLLRNLTPNPSARQHLLTVVATFWRRNPQFHLIVLDKLLQYRLVDTQDVVAWMFAPGEEQKGPREKTWADVDLWGQVKIVLRTVQSRVDSAAARVEGLMREAEARAAAEETGEGKGLEGTVDAEGDVPVRDASAANPDDEREISLASSAVDEAEQEQASTLVEILGQFAKRLPEGVDKNDWETWWTEGWVREFCRSSLKPKALALPAVSKGIDDLNLASVSPSVKSIVDAAKAWHDFA